MIASVIGSLTQPLFYRGANIARLKIAKAQQQEALLSFEQAILNAGSEVSNALNLYQTAQDKIVQREKQIESLEKIRRIYSGIINLRNLYLSGSPDSSTIFVKRPVVGDS